MNVNICKKMAWKELIIAAICLLSVSFAEELKPVGELKSRHPDVGLRVPELIAKYGYPVETYTMTTEDDYILSVHRIPHGKTNANEKNKPVVFLMHGLLCSSADWVIMGPEKGLAYILADMGYDVWMGNARGNTYSRKHTSLNPNRNHAFWKFSWHHIGKIDLPTMIDFVLAKTQEQKLFYIGHSQGTTSFFVMTSTRPEYNDKIRMMVALAPVAYMKNIPNIAFRLISKLHNTIGWIVNMLGTHEFMPSTKFMQLIGQALCNDNSALQDMCSNILFLIAGYDSPQLNSTMIPVILSNTPAGAATKQILHYAQGIDSDNEFKQYDYGMLENIVKYGKAKPPAYDLKKITAPVALFYGENDLLTHEDDVYQLYEDLGHSILNYKVKYAKFSHLDFLWSIDIKELLYKKMFDIMERY